MAWTLSLKVSKSVLCIDLEPRPRCEGHLPPVCSIRRSVLPSARLGPGGVWQDGWPLDHGRGHHPGRGTTRWWSLACSLLDSDSANSAPCVIATPPLPTTDCQGLSGGRVRPTEGWSTETTTPGGTLVPWNVNGNGMAYRFAFFFFFFFFSRLPLAIALALST